MSSLTVALVQSDIAWLDVDSNLASLSDTLSSLDGVDLILLPETFATGFAFDVEGIGEVENGPVFNWMKGLAAEKNAVVAGTVAVNKDGKNANRMYWVSPDGSFKHYDKRHLFRMGNEQDHVVAGEKREVFELKGFRLLPQICYDLRFPVWARNRNDYDVMINLANWPAVRRKPYDTLLLARAIENQCYVLAVNRVGDDGKGIAHSGGTAVIDYKGDLIEKVADDTPGVLVQTLSLDALKRFRKAFPAHLDGDDFTLSL